MNIVVYLEVARKYIKRPAGWGVESQEDVPVSPGDGQEGQQ